MLVCVYREENLAKIARRVKDYKVEELNPPREGKRLLVLDVDYTLFGELHLQRPSSPLQHNPETAGCMTCKVIAC